MDGVVSSLVKWNPVANVEGLDIWNFLRTMNVPINSLHSQGCISIGCEPCKRPVLPRQHEREGGWWWEVAKAKERGFHEGNIKQEESQLNGNGNGAAPTNGMATVPDIFNDQNLVNLCRARVENLAGLENRREPWLVLLYAPWCCSCQVNIIGGANHYHLELRTLCLVLTIFFGFKQVMEGSYVKLSEKLAGSGVKFRADGERKAHAQEELQLGSFPTIFAWMLLLGLSIPSNGMHQR